MRIGFCRRVDGPIDQTSDNSLSSSSARTFYRNNQPSHHGGCSAGRSPQLILFPFGQGWCGLPDPALLSTSLLLAASTASAEINKPLSDWLCDYCSMGRPQMSLIFPPLILDGVCLSSETAGPPEVEDECGTPILCMFYGLLFCILCMTIYTTLKGTTD